MYPLHENESGSFQELAHAPDLTFGQLSVLLIHPTCSRGGHYHTRKEEWFCCIHGKCEMMMRNVKDGTLRKVILEDKRREFIKVLPFESHTVTNFSDNQNCELLIIISEEYNLNDPDTFKYEENKSG
jgi:UDP-2-acetamido-2,6-beta-L-arabino-hexul-4-ose reductase